MSTYTEQEELDRLKDWWKSYGGALIAGVVIGVLVLVGTKYWSQFKEEALQEASGIYHQMLQDIRAGKLQPGRDAGRKLVDDYRRTPYAGMAALMLAKLSYDAGDAAAAREHLRWATNNAADDATVHAARLRLARLMAAAGENAPALALLDVPGTDGFDVEYAELRGDLLTALGRTDDARRAYTEALKYAGETPYKQILTIKRDGLGPEVQQ